MKRLILTFALAIGVAGCLGGYTPAEPTGGGEADMAQHSGTGGNGGDGGTTGGGGSGGGGGDHGTSTDMASPTNDLAGVTPGPNAFGATCTVDSDCQTLMCRMFAMGTVHRCTRACGAGVAPGASDPTDCPAPSAGTCTNATPPYCKFTQ